ncbi:MAG: type I-F CRISPR-associated protein Csy2 [Thermodesulfobacteriota bacterium]|nr:type I-F CRISPR-associated protein Csy2 [Thermodesulfobacteriota bacterium]
MRQFILIDHIKVQNANAVAGFTWGFPAITHFLGFVHNLSRKLANEKNLQDMILNGCAVVAHGHKVHTYWSKKDGYRFAQSRNPPYLHGIEAAKKSEAPPVIEEGKMNMTVSLLIGFDGNIGNRTDGFRQWLKNTCLMQRLAGGTLFGIDIENISFHTPENARDVRLITRRLLPGFVLQDRSQYLKEHYQELVKNNPDAELLDAWLDFYTLKQKARPKSNLISKHIPC